MYSDVFSYCCFNLQAELASRLQGDNCRPYRVA